MNRLEIKLKQHTPLIHFQHDQEGATLRASEVKPKLDRFVLTRLGQGNYQVGIAQAKTNGWLIGKGDHPALDYKMRIEATAFKDVSIPVKPQKVKGVQQYDDFGRELYTTNNYPDNKASLIMSNIGGRVREEVFNMVIANHIKMIEYARSLGDILIVGVNTDELVESYKSQPIIPFDERIALVKALKYPDIVIPQHSLDHADKVNKLNFDVFVVGDDWAGKYDYLKEQGVDVVYFPYGAGVSSTNLKQRIYENYEKMKHKADNHLRQQGFLSPALCREPQRS